MQNAPPVPRAPTPDAPPPRGTRFFSAFPVWIWIALAGLFGGVIGLGGFTFSYASGLSYLSNDPAACVNCHIMREQFDGWNAGPHHAVATCNDCHTPHNFVGKYMTKARNGFWHSYYFTTQTFHEPIRIGAASLAITESTCRSCHSDMVEAIASHPGPGGEASCVRCHPSVGHREFGAVGSVPGGVGH